METASTSGGATATVTLETIETDHTNGTDGADAPAGLDERLFEATIGALELLSIYLGQQLGLYPHLTERRTAPELATAAGIDRRYAREWLEQQAVAGLVSTDADVQDWDRRPYWLDGEQRAVFVEADDPAHVSPFAGMVLGQRVRRSLSETLFRRVFFIALLALGAYIVASALLPDS